MTVRRETLAIVRVTSSVASQVVKAVLNPEPFSGPGEGARQDVRLASWKNESKTGRTLPSVGLLYDSKTLRAKRKHWPKRELRLTPFLRGRIIRAPSQPWIPSCAIDRGPGWDEAEG